MNNSSNLLVYVSIIVVLVIIIIILLTVIVTTLKVKKSSSAIDEEDFNKQLNIVNEKIAELNDYYSFISEQLDSKQKELLFLYQMINLKGDQINNLTVDKSQSKSSKKQIKNNKKTKNKSNGSNQSINEFNKQVVKLYKEGYNVEQIAKKMQKGKGAVELAVKIYC